MEGIGTIFGVMHPGVAVLVLIGILVALLVVLLKSGIVRIKISNEDDEEIDIEDIKALDDSTFKNRLAKWLVKLYEKEVEKDNSRDDDEEE